MSSEDFHKALISRLDPETVSKALERYNKKSLTAESSIDNFKPQNVSSKIDNSMESISILPEKQKYSLQPRYLKPSLGNNLHLFVVHMPR